MRRDQFCLAVHDGDPCGPTQILWTLRGSASGFGAFLPRLVEDGELRMDLMTGEAGWPVDVHRTPDGRSFRAALDVPPLSILRSDPGTRTYEFRDGEEMPLRTQSDSYWNRTAYQEGPELPPIPAWPRIDLGEGGPRPDRMFPGDDLDLFGIGTTVRQAAEELKRQAPEAARLMRDGCIVKIELLPHIGDQEGVLPMLSEKGAGYDFWLAADDGQVRRWEAYYQEGGVEGPRWTVQELSQDEYDFAACNEYFKARGRNTTVQEAMEVPRVLGLEEAPTRLTVFAAPQGRLLPTGEGWPIYTFSMPAPEGYSGFFGFYVSVSVYGGFLQGAFVPGPSTT